jgi:hypothetical protein
VGKSYAAAGSEAAEQTVARPWRCFYREKNVEASLKKDQSHNSERSEIYGGQGAVLFWRWGL